MSGRTKAQERWEQTETVEDMAGAAFQRAEELATELADLRASLATFRMQMISALDDRHDRLVALEQVKS